MTILSFLWFLYFIFICHLLSWRCTGGNGMLPKFASYVMCAFSLCIIMYVWGFGFKIECFKLNSVSRNLRYWTPEYLSASHGRLCKHGRFCTKNLIFSVWWKKIRNVMLVNIISVIYVNITLHKIPQFHLISWCGNFVERHSFCRVYSVLITSFSLTLFSVGFFTL